MELESYQPHALYVSLDRVPAALESRYAAELTAIRSLERLDLHPHVTFFMKVKWTPAAKKHLKGVHDYIAAVRLPMRRLVDRITWRTQQLASFPESGGKVLEHDDPAIREVLEGSYRIIYRIGKNQVEVLAVIHGARQLPDSV
jgi:plasmid stabilization system protein ParE